MDYSRVAVAKKALEVAGIPIPTNEEDLRKRAYEHLVGKDFLAAHSIRLGKNHTDYSTGFFLLQFLRLLVIILNIKRFCEQSEQVLIITIT